MKKAIRLVLPLLMLIAGLMLIFMNTLIGQWRQLPDLIKGIMMGIGIGLECLGARLIMRYKNMASR